MKVELAVSILNWAPKLTGREARLATEFMSEEANTKAMQRKVAQTLPGRSKGGLIASETESFLLLSVNIGSTMSSGSWWGVPTN